MLELDEYQYQAPFQPDKVGEKNRRKAFSIFSAEPLAFKSQDSARPDVLLPKKSSFPGADLTQKKTPIYIEELTLSKFIEDYLDFICIETQNKFK